MAVYRKLTNDVYARKTITNSYTYWDDAFNAEELDRVVDYCDKFELQKGMTLGNLNKTSDDDEIDNREPAPEVRRSDIKFLTPNEHNQWIFERINGVIEILNDRFYNMDLYGYDSLQYTEYNSEEKGHYGFHMDSAVGGANAIGDTRKLSLSMFLNDPSEYKGGKFQFNEGTEKNAIDVPQVRGRMILFPSFMIHRVTPVTKGVRKSLVAWVLGPKFR
jgi:PKHD-type hydroxylase